MTVRIIQGDCLTVLRSLADVEADCCVTSPPYWSLRDYGCDGQVGNESTPDAYVTRLVEVFREVRRVLKNDGTLWLNLGDTWNAYNGNRGRSTSFNSAIEVAVPAVPSGAGLTCKTLKTKDMIGVPWRVAFALQADGWWLRQDLIWHKPNAKPESVTDRCTQSHEYLFLLSKSSRYYYDQDAIREQATSAGGGASFGAVRHDGPGSRRLTDEENAEIRDGTRNKRSVWTVTTSQYRGAHFATFPPALIEPCVLAGSRRGGTVLDPFGGSGTTGAVAVAHGRHAILAELNPEYVAMAHERIRETQALLF